MTKRVLSVGNCVPDNRAITAMLQNYFSVEVVPADNLTDTLTQLNSSRFDLVLVNRVLDRDGSEGLEVIRQIKSTANLRDTPVMMITNFADHQQRAVEAGALAAFVTARIILFIGKEKSISLTDADYIGTTGTVSSTIRKNRIGRVSVEVKGRFRRLPAKSIDGEKIEKGAKIEIVDKEHGYRRNVSAN